MKQVIFAIALLAMASLTGCLTDDESSVDETTDTTSDNTGNTNDNSDTSQDNTDSGDGGMIDPVGTDGVTIPEDSSIFMDSHEAFGGWDCTGDGKDKVCNYDFHNDDGFKEHYNVDGALSYVSYHDSDGIGNDIDFNGWVNKTGNTVTIETLKYPDRGPTIYYDQDSSIHTHYYYRYVNQYVSSTCNNGQTCEIIFYGHNGLIFNAKFTLSTSTSWSYYEDTNGDGTDDRHNYRYQYAYNTPTFELPFEPYAFTITYDENSGVSRIF